MNKHPLWTAKEAETATEGSSNLPWTADGVAIDSRSIQTGDLFIAIAGPNFDGHHFVGDALSKGAAAAMVSRLPDELAPTAPLLTVKDTERGLNALGAYARSRTGARIAAISGSVGKTGIKEALALVLSDQGKTSATVGNLNNHWGLPLSLARMPKDADFGVLEMGMNHPGELTPLSKLAQPHVALITTVEPVHAEFFSSIEEIADAKAEIFAGIEKGGTIVLNKDNSQFDRLLKAAQKSNAGRIVSFGTDKSADCHIVEASLSAEGAGVTASIHGDIFTYDLGMPGRHWVLNSVAVLATACALGADVKAATRKLADMTPGKGRGLRRRVNIRGGYFTLIDESYNASPVSMMGAIETLGRFTPKQGGRRIAVLGDMLELGSDGPDLHRTLAKSLSDAKVDLAFLSGPLMENLWNDLPDSMKGAYAPKSSRLLSALRANLRIGDVVMVKGSAGSQMGTVIDGLLDMDQRSALSGQDSSGHEN